MSKNCFYEKFDIDGDGNITCEEYHQILSKILDPSWFLMEIESVYFALHELNFNLSTEDYDFAINKIQAIKTLFTTDSFFNIYDVFEKICLAINNQKVFFLKWQDLGLENIITALLEVSQIIDYVGEDFSEDIKAFIASKLCYEGLLVCPPILSFCQDFLDKANSEKIGHDKLKSLKKEISEAFSDGIDNLSLLDEVVSNQVSKLIFFSSLAKKNMGVKK